jgi:hypothetical protein
MGYTASDLFPELLETMKKAAGAPREAEVPFLLGGGLAAWARGGPPTDHDVDFFVRERDAERGLQALEDAGMRTERPPEGWLVKAWEGDVLVDLIFHPSGGPVGDAYFERAEALEVAAQPLLVASLDDVLATKVLAMSEQDPDFRPVLEIARSLREQIDWVSVRAQVEDTPFGAAFLTLVERLRILPDSVGALAEPWAASVGERPPSGARPLAGSVGVCPRRELTPCEACGCCARRGDRPLRGQSSPLVSQSPGGNA